MNLLALIPAAATPPIPNLDVHAAMPAWWGIFSVLAVVTFALHLVFMNVTLGGGVLLVVGRFARKPDGLLAGLRDEVGHNLPVTISLTITTGVAPLLFAQVLYPQFFYSAAILIGRFWLLILVFLIVGFYAAYLCDRLRPGGGSAGRWLMQLILVLVTAGSFLAIAYLFTNHAVATIEPGRWGVLLKGEKTLHVGSPQWLPRLLHTFVGATAVTGLYIACIGQVARIRRGRAEPGRRLTQIGLQIALVATLVQIMVGLWFFLSVEPGPRTSLYNPVVGGVGSVAWIVGIALAIGGMWLMLRGWMEPDSLRWTLAACGAIFMTLIGMSAGRERLRLTYLEPYLAAKGFPPPQWQPNWQFASLAIFLVTFVVGLALLWLVVRWWWQLPQELPEQEDADAAAEAAGPEA